MGSVKAKPSSAPAHSRRTPTAASAAFSPSAIASERHATALETWLKQNNVQVQTDNLSMAECHHAHEVLSSMLRGQMKPIQVSTDDAAEEEWAAAAAVRVAPTPTGLRDQGGRDPTPCAMLGSATPLPSPMAHGGGAATTAKTTRTAGVAATANNDDDYYDPVMDMDDDERTVMYESELREVDWNDANARQLPFQDRGGAVVPDAAAATAAGTGGETSCTDEMEPGEAAELMTRNASMRAAMRGAVQQYLRENSRVHQEDIETLGGLDEATAIQAVDAMHPELPWTIVESYFHEHGRRAVVRHQLESFNYFLQHQMPQTVELFRHMHILSDHDFDMVTRRYSMEVDIYLSNFRIMRPQLHESNGAVKIMFPHEARLRNLTYASTTSVDMEIVYTVRTGDQLEHTETIRRTLPRVNMGKVPIMVRSAGCVLNEYPHATPEQTGECAFDVGGYFIIRGSEKVVIGQERTAENQIACNRAKSNDRKVLYTATIKSVPDDKTTSAKKLTMNVVAKRNLFGHPITVEVPRIAQTIPIMILFRALGVETDQAIFDIVMLNMDDAHMLPCIRMLQASVIAAEGYSTVEASMRYVADCVAYLSPVQDKSKPIRTYIKYVQELLATEVFPHCQTPTQRIFQLGYMVQRLMLSFLDVIPEDDRDSVMNKRVDTVGSLLNNIHRCAMHRLVRDVEKFVRIEITSGSWRAKNDVANMLHMGNIYKMFRPYTLESAMMKALSTGDFSVRRGTNSKVGVSQVLNRLNHLSTLSNLRRQTAPLERDNGKKLTAPRQLHSTSWGYTCPVETPEGHTVGMVKGLSFLCHMALPSDSRPVYQAVMPLIEPIPDVWVPSTADEADPFLEVYRERYAVQQAAKERAEAEEEARRAAEEEARRAVEEEARRAAEAEEAAAATLADDSSEDGTVIEVWEGQVANVEPAEHAGDLTNEVEQESAAADAASSAPPARAPHKHTHPTVVPHVGPVFPAFVCTQPELASELPRRLAGAVKVFINGNWVGITRDPMTVYRTLKTKKLDGSLNPYISIAFNMSAKEIRILTDGDRMVRPVFRVEKNRLMASTRIMAQVLTHELSWSDLMRSDAATGRPAVLEYIDCAESNTSAIAMSPESFFERCKPRFTHCEIHPATILGVVAICVVFPDHNQSPRNTYQSAQGKQVMGVPATNYDVRMDTTAYLSHDSTMPLVETRPMRILNMHRICAGHQRIVAIMAHTGYNQEDSLLLSKGANDRGMALATLFHTERDDDRQSTTGEEDVRGRPDIADTRGMKRADYSKVDATTGLVPENTLLTNRTVLIAKMSPVKEDSEPAGSPIRFEDRSILVKTFEESYVDRNYMGINGDGYKFVKTRIRALRKPVVGDKFSSRHGQKGTVGLICPDCDMPFTSEGLRPDIIINPHAIPSRMTIGHLIESNLGKALLGLGLFGDGTAYNKLSIHEIGRVLQREGYESYGNEVFYNGLTGEQFECNVFVGSVYYQRLKHMVNDKVHSRAHGPTVNYTRQPTEGRSRDGGLRVGPMERDCMVSHGAARFTRERMYDVSDKYQVHVCKSCGVIAAYNAMITIHECKSCANRTEFAYVQLPYACKLLFQELEICNIVPRIITDSMI